MPGRTENDPVTSEDEGLPVLDSEGNQIGVVSTVDEDDVIVDPDADMSDDARASLGWSETENARYSLSASDLEYVAGEDVFEWFPRTELDTGTGEDEDPGDVLCVDLGDVNRRG